MLQIYMHESAFLRFTVQDMSSNHISAQRVIPLSCLKPGKINTSCTIIASMKPATRVCR